MTFTALPITSAGRFSPLGPVGIVFLNNTHHVGVGVALPVQNMDHLNYAQEWADRRFYSCDTFSNARKRLQNAIHPSRFGF